MVLIVFLLKETWSRNSHSHQKQPKTVHKLLTIARNYGGAGGRSALEYSERILSKESEIGWCISKRSSFYTI